MTSSFSQHTRAAESILSPVDRVSEIVFGLIMALTFTGTLSVYTADRTEVRGMLIGALGCNIAWGMVDAVMFVLANLAERGRALGREQSHVRLSITGTDLKGAVGVFLLVFLSTIPVALPFLFIHEAHRALRVSNIVALAMLFICGFVLGNHAGGRKWAGAFLMLMVGVVLVWATIALGG
jgi:VIT1/CCC1 family predicted Fe2+/Mn2+ transporter